MKSTLSRFIFTYSKLAGGGFILNAQIARADSRIRGYPGEE